MSVTAEESDNAVPEREVTIRLLSESDSLEELTELLHRSYKQLADMGLRYLATHQDVETTRDRIAFSECYVAELDGRIVGTIALERKSRGCDWYEREEVASFHQFGVEPSLQGKGIGSLLLDHIEKRARELGAEELALDTADRATRLIDMYEKRGYRIVGRVNWDVTNYDSVVMSKRLVKDIVTYYRFMLWLSIALLIAAMYWRIAVGGFEWGWDDPAEGQLPPHPFRNQSGYLILFGSGFVIVWSAIAALVKWERRWFWPLVLAAIAVAPVLFFPHAMV